MFYGAALSLLSVTCQTEHYN